MTKEQFQPGVRVFILDKEHKKLLGTVMFLWSGGQAHPDIAVKLDNGTVARITDNVMGFFSLEPSN